MDNFKIRDTFGLSRVIEPKTAVPATAWRLDNSREISPRECRIALKTLHLERDSFQQLCSESGFDEVKIKARVMDIIKRRGKLHNPFTGSGGILCGTIDEMGSEYRAAKPFSPGDQILGLATTTSLPMHIEKIHSIDYNYGELAVEGYAILFQSSPISPLFDDLSPGYTMATLDEGGSLYNIHTMAFPGMSALVIGKDLISAIVYMAAVKQDIGDDCRLIAVLDDEAIGSMSPEEIKRLLSKWADAVYITDLSRPIDTCESIRSQGEKPVDMTINCEDLKGSEVFSVLMTKSKGKIYFTSLKNNYARCVLVAESIGHQVETYSLDQYSQSYNRYTHSLLLEVKEDLDAINRLYKKHPGSPRKPQKQSTMIAAEKAGKTKDFIYTSPVTAAICDQALNIADYDCSVIIQGETGVGKEKILELIHKNSSRRSKPCIKINCATIQENLAESEFFGYEPGAFTGAGTSGKKGYFQLANGGILFLDEVGQLSNTLQSKLLRVLQENRFYKVGGTSPTDIDVRVICANNIPLKQLVDQGKFREDLYYRFNICTITVPPLRERKEDIFCLAEAFLRKYCERYGVDKSLDLAALNRLTEYHWPGNVRELENLIHRTIINTKDHVITYEDIESMLNETVYNDLIPDLKNTLRNPDGLDFNEIISAQEKRLIEYALKKCGSTRKAARFLGMSQPQLMRKKQKYDIM